MISESEFREIRRELHQIHRKRWRGSELEGSEHQYDSCSHAEKVFSLIFYFIDEVNNGGFKQWIGNATGYFVRETYDALLEIGATRVADMVARTMALFPGGCPPRDSGPRREQVFSLPKAQDDFLNSLGEPFSDEEYELHYLLLKYWEANKPKPKEF